MIDDVESELISVPASVWRINIDVPQECSNISLGTTDERWWEQEDLSKLILASNILTHLSEDIGLLPALSVLDVSLSQYVLGLPQMVFFLKNK